MDFFIALLIQNPFNHLFQKVAILMHLMLFSVVSIHTERDKNGILTTENGI